MVADAAFETIICLSRLQESQIFYDLQILNLLLYMYVKTHKLQWYYIIGQHFCFTTYIDRNLRPVIFNIMKSEVRLEVYYIFLQLGFQFYYMYSSKSEVRPVTCFKK